MKLSASDIVIKVLGLLLLTAAMLKGWQLLTEPVANTDIWSNRGFLILTVELELALGLWLVSGLFKRAAYIVVVGCFSVFCCVTLYKALAGYGSCGCFGKVHVNPWITLLAIDLPGLIALVIWRPKDLALAHLARPIELLKPLPAVGHFVVVFIIGLGLLGVTTPILAVNEPAAVTSSYEVLEPEMWVGKELPILEHIDIAEQIKTGNWLVLFYHHDCPDCQKAIVEYKQMARDLKGNEDFLQIAFIEVPPYAHGQINENSPCSIGKLLDTKDWFVTTPAVVLLEQSNVKRAWEGQAPAFENIIESFAMTNGINNKEKQSTFSAARPH
jgi:hypothetical protein